MDEGKGKVNNPDEAKQNVDTKNETEKSPKTVDEAFENLKQNGRNSVDNLVRWMKKSNVIEDTKEAESATKKLFDDVKDKKNIALDKFKQVIGKLASDVKKNPAAMFSKLTGGISQVEGAVKKAAQFMSGIPGVSARREDFQEGGSQEQWSSPVTQQDNLNLNQPSASEEQGIHPEATQDDLNVHNDQGTPDEQSSMSVQSNDSYVDTQDENATESGSPEDQATSSPQYSSAPTDSSD